MTEINRVWTPLPFSLPSPGTEPHSLPSPPPPIPTLGEPVQAEGAPCPPQPRGLRVGAMGPVLPIRDPSGSELLFGQYLRWVALGSGSRDRQEEAPSQGAELARWCPRFLTPPHAAQLPPASAAPGRAPGSGPGTCPVAAGGCSPDSHRISLPGLNPASPPAALANRPSNAVVLSPLQAPSATSAWSPRRQEP